jgi:elongation factor G
MHADEMEDIDSAGPGDIVAIFGLDCHSGDTFTDGKLNVAMTSIHVPNAVISLSVKPVDNKSQINLMKALSRFPRKTYSGAGADPGPERSSSMDGRAQPDAHRAHVARVRVR